MNVLRSKILMLIFVVLYQFKTKFLMRSNNLIRVLSCTINLIFEVELTYLIMQQSFTRVTHTSNNDAPLFVGASCAI